MQQNNPLISNFFCSKTTIFGINWLCSSVMNCCHGLEEDLLVCRFLLLEGLLH